MTAPAVDATIIREALAHMAAGPPDNGVSHRRALDALSLLVERAERAEAALAAIASGTEFGKAMRAPRCRVIARLTLAARPPASGGSLPDADAPGARRVG